jgi:hypothetical protein
MKVQFDTPVDLSEWEWGDFDNATDQIFSKLETLSRAVALDLQKVLQDELQKGIEVSLDTDGEGDLVIAIPITGKDPPDDLTATVSLAKLLDGITNADARARWLQHFNALSDMMGLPPGHPGNRP